MGIFDFFKSNSATKRDVKLERIIERQIQTLLGGTIVTLDENDETYIQDGYNKNLFVYMCVSFITRRASDIPIRLYRFSGNGDDEEITDHPILDLLKNPNAYSDGKEFIEKSLGYYLLTGNNYTWKVNSTTDPSRPPLELHTLPSQFVDIKSGKTWAHPAKKYILRNFADVQFDADNVIHFRSPNYTFENGQHLYGQSPLRAALNALNLSNSTSEAFTKQAQNEGVKGLLMQRADSEVAPMTPEQLKDFKKKVKDSINGKDKRGLIEATNTLFDYIQLGMSAADMQLLEAHKVGRNDICAIYGLSSMLFNDNSASTFNNLNEAKKSAYTDAIIPLLNNWVSSLNKGLVSQVDSTLYLQIDTSGIEELKADRAKLISSLAQAWWIPTSEKQRMTDYEPDGMLPEYLIPSGLFPVDGSDLPPIDEEIDKAVREFGINKL